MFRIGVSGWMFFWYWLTQFDLDKMQRPINGCSSVIVLLIMLVVCWFMWLTSWGNFWCVFLGSVFCVNISLSKSLAITGGEDDVSYVWNVPNGDMVFKCTGQCLIMFLLHPGRVQNIVMSMSSFLSLWSHNLKIAWLNFIKLFMPVAYVHGLVLLWQCCDMLCTSSFVDDVMFSPNGPMCIPKQWYNTKSVTAEIPTGFCSAVKTSKYLTWVSHWRQSLLSTVISFLFANNSHLLIILSVL